MLLYSVPGEPPNPEQLSEDHVLLKHATLSSVYTKKVRLEKVSLPLRECFTYCLGETGQHRNFCIDPSLSCGLLVPSMELAAVTVPTKPANLIVVKRV